MSGSGVGSPGGPNINYGNCLTPAQNYCKEQFKVLPEIVQQKSMGVGQYNINNGYGSFNLKLSQPIQLPKFRGLK